jgi:hypothetical protein
LGLFDWFDPIELGIRDRVLKRGKTPLLTTDQARVLLDSIDTARPLQKPHRKSPVVLSNFPSFFALDLPAMICPLSVA